MKKLSNQQAQKDKSENVQSLDFGPGELNSRVEKEKRSRKYPELNLLLNEFNSNQVKIKELSVAINKLQARQQFIEREFSKKALKETNVTICKKPGRKQVSKPGKKKPTELEKKLIKICKNATPEMLSKILEGISK